MVAVKKDKVSGDSLGTGRRKSAVARVRVRSGSGKVVINRRPLEEYFNNDQDRRTILEVLEDTRASGRTLVVVHHDLTTAGEYFDTLILLKQRLFAYGKPADVLHPELLSEVYEGKLRVFAHLEHEQQQGTAGTPAPAGGEDGS